MNKYQFFIQDLFFEKPFWRFILMSETLEFVPTADVVEEEEGFSISDVPMWAIGAGVCGVAALAGGIYYLFSGSGVSYPSDTPDEVKKIIDKSVDDLITAIEKASEKAPDRSAVTDYIKANWADCVVGYRNNDRVRYDAIRKDLGSLCTIILKIPHAQFDAIFQKARSDLDVAFGRTAEKATAKPADQQG